MKKNSIFRFLALLPLLALLMGSGTMAEPTAEIYPLDGMEAPFYYVAQKPLSQGDDGELAVIMIHGWYGGVQILKEQFTLMTTFDNAYIVSPLYPRAQTMESRKIDKNSRARWNDSWSRDLTIPGSPDDD